MSSQQKRSAKHLSGNSGSMSSNTGVSLGPWSAWSDWSTCSRTCDGGVMQQIRRCQNANGCKGESVRYRICNMQPCPDQQDFRARQCVAYNDVPYDGTLYKWTPHYDYVEPCALTCRYVQSFYLYIYFAIFSHPLLYAPRFQSQKKSLSYSRAI